MRWKNIVNYHFGMINEKGRVGEGEIEVFLGGIIERRNCCGDDFFIIWRQESLPNDVVFCYIFQFFGHH